MLKRGEKMNKRIFAIPCEPCAAIAMEAWLISMAEKGWLLKNDGILFGFALFEKGEEQTLRYRLRASLEKPGLLAPNGGEPDEEEKEFARAEGWEYVARWGDFFIYRTGDSEAPELDTDEKVRGMAIRAVRKRIVSDVIWILVYFLLIGGLRLSWLSTMLVCKTPFILCGIALLGIMIGEEVAKIVRLCRLGKESGRTDFRMRGRLLAVWRIFKWAATITFICVFIGKWSDSVLDKDKIRLEDYRDDPPFATLADFFPEGEYSLAPYAYTNEVREWSDWLAPRMITYNEAADITLEDGKVFSSGLYVQYYALRTPFLAKWLYKELTFREKWKKGYEELALPTLTAEQSVGFTNDVHFPNVILRKGNLVLHVQFYKTGETVLTFDEWVGIEDDFLRQQP